MTQHILNLNDSDWQFGQVTQCPFTNADVYDLPDVTEWLPATVPGNVRTDLLALGQIPDPFYAEDYQQSLWVEDVDWWYKRTITIDALKSGQRAFLILNSIDYLSAIFVNGQEMARHEGMFSRQIIEITDALQTGQAEIAVRVWGSGALPQRRLNWAQKIWQKTAGLFYGGWAGIYPARSATLKCQMSFGWDFAPPIRTMGIWDDVSLVMSESVFLADANATGVPLDLQSLAPDATHTPAKITVNLELDVDQPQPVDIDIHLIPANFQGETFGPLNFSRDLPAGHSAQQMEFEIPKTALWQPWDRGESCLYHVQINIKTPQDQTLAAITTRMGIRSIQMEQWQFTVNGQRTFMRGLNWVPADSFPGRLTPERYRQLLAQAKDGNANLLRVWGGGLREKQAFYDLCDELGLLVWQEFPFACMFLGSFPRDENYLSLVKSECSDIVRQLRHHPSVALWCGGNEFSQRRNQPLLKTLADVVSRLDPERSFVPTSPGSQQGHDTHNWDVWHGDAPVSAYQLEHAHFLSEFGLQALPHAQTLKTILADSAQDWHTHCADEKKLTRYVLPFMLAETESPEPGKPKMARVSFLSFAIPQPDMDADEFLQTNITASQRAQAAALQTAIEQMRRQRDTRGGVCVWQFNEPWPAISWAIVDYFGRPKLAYNQLHDWYNPILVSLKFPVGHQWQKEENLRLEIWGINDSLQSLEGCELHVKLNNKQIYHKQLDLAANSATQIDVVSQPLTDDIPADISLTLQHQGKLLAQNNYDLAWFDESAGSLAKRLKRRIADLILR